MRRLLLQLCLGLVIAGTASAQFKPRKLGELELVLSGLSATVDPVKVTVPKNTASGVRISIRGGAGEVTIAEAEQRLGRAFDAQAIIVTGCHPLTAADIDDVADYDEIRIYASILNDEAAP